MGLIEHLWKGNKRPQRVASMSSFRELSPAPFRNQLLLGLHLTRLATQLESRNSNMTAHLLEVRQHFEIETAGQ
jgi:hypothetical protein